MFFSKPVSDVQAAQNKTADILGAFTTAIDGLSNIAEQANEQAETKVCEANKLIVDAESLRAIATKNKTIAQKLQQIIS